MTTITLFLLTTTLALIFTQITHPLAMGMILLIQTVVTCLVTGMMAHSFWFSYILFLVFLGGLLVLFIYVTSLASNEMFSFTPHAFFTSLLYLTISIITYFIIDPLTLPLNSNSPDSMNTFLPDSINESTPALMKLYNEPTSSITLMLALYLFLTLIAVVKITKIFSGPLRQKN